MFNGLRERLKALERRKAENPLPPEGGYTRLIYDLYGNPPDTDLWEADIEIGIAMIEADAARMQENGTYFRGCDYEHHGNN